MVYRYRIGQRDPKNEGENLEEENTKITRNLLNLVYFPVMSEYGYEYHLAMSIRLDSQGARK